MKLLAATLAAVVVFSLAMVTPVRAATVSQTFLLTAPGDTAALSFTSQQQCEVDVNGPPQYLAATPQYSSTGGGYVAASNINGGSITQPGSYIGTNPGGFSYFRLHVTSFTGPQISGQLVCNDTLPVGASNAAPADPSSIPVSATGNNYVIAQHSTTPTSQPGNDMLQGFRVAAGGSPTLSMLTAGDFMTSETTAKGRIWAGQAVNSAAVGVVYIALTELQAANSLPPNAGDVLTITINAHAVAYTVQAGDTTMATLATNVAAAINADGTSNLIVSAVGSTSGTLGLVTITALTSGICCRYSLSSSVSGGAKETLNSFPLMDVAGYYLDEGKNVTGWSVGTDLGSYTFDHSGNFVGPAGHNLNIKGGAGASSAITFNLNNPGNYNGIAIYDGSSNVNNADLLYPMNVHIITGPLEAEICQYVANNCTSAPTNPGYVGEWLNVNGSNSGPTQHQQFGTCSAALTCTLNWGVSWTSATSYSCVVTAEGAADDPHITTKTASQTVFTGSTSVVRDFLCSGI